MRLVYERHSGARGYTPEDFRAAVREVVGESAPTGDSADEGEGGHTAQGEDRGVDALLDAWVDGTSELSFEEALEYYGLAFEGDEDAEADDPEGSANDDDDDDDTAGWLGVKQEGGFITEVRRDGPAYGAGFSHDDEILAIDGFRVRDLAVHLSRYRPGDAVSVTLARRGRLREVSVTLGRAPGEDVYSLSDADPVTAQQLSHRAAWLEDVDDVPEPASAPDPDVAEASAGNAAQEPAQNPATPPAVAPSVVAPARALVAPGDDPGQEGQPGEQNAGPQHDG